MRFRWLAPYGVARQTSENVKQLAKQQERGAGDVGNYYLVCKPISGLAAIEQVPARFRATSAAKTASPAKLSVRLPSTISLLCLRWQVFDEVARHICVTRALLAMQLRKIVHDVIAYGLVSKHISGVARGAVWKAKFCSQFVLLRSYLQLTTRPSAPSQVTRSVLCTSLARPARWPSRAPGEDRRAMGCPTSCTGRFQRQCGRAPGHARCEFARVSASPGVAEPFVVVCRCFPLFLHACESSS